MSWTIRSAIPPWLNFSKKAGQANKDAIDVHLDAKGLNDSTKLRASLVFEATTTVSGQEPVVVEIGRLEVDSSVVAVPSPSRSVLRLRHRKRMFDAGIPVEVGPGDAMEVLITAADEDGMQVQREDRSFSLLFKPQGQGPAQLTASYSREEGVYMAQLTVPDDLGQHTLWVESVFGFGLLSDGSPPSGLPSHANPVTLIAVESIGTIKRAVTVAIAVLLVLGLAGLLFYARKNRARLKVVFVSLMSNEGLQGLQVANESIDFASDAIVYHTVATDFRHLDTLFMCYTICFAVSCLASSISLGIKMKALVAQLRSRRLASNYSADNDDGDRETTLRLRLEHCRKDLLLTYAGVLTCALEGPNKSSAHQRCARARFCLQWWVFADLPMGILAIFLANASDTKLSTFTQVCTAYSWLNVGGKLLKIAGLKQQLAQESDVKRKLTKLLGETSNEADADPAALEVTRFGLVNRLKYSGVGRWFGAVANRKDARRRNADLELEFVRGVIIQEKQRRNGAAAAAAIAVEDLGLAVGLCTSPSAVANWDCGAEILPEL
jgi:hypothetical protein